MSILKKQFTIFTAVCGPRVELSLFPKMAHIKLHMLHKLPFKKGTKRTNLKCLGVE